VDRDFVEWFFETTFPEPHSTKQIEDAVGYALDTDPETLIATAKAPVMQVETVEEICSRLGCPVLVIHGEDDRIVDIAVGARLAELTGAPLMRIPGVGHCPQARKPVLVNIALREFVQALERSPPALPQDVRSVALG
jgi:pimeloyl-ACP methyl ester carboxylesterase